MYRTLSAVLIASTFLLLLLPVASITLHYGDVGDVGFQASGWDVIRGVNIGALFGRDELRLPSEYWFASAFFWALMSLLCEAPRWPRLVLGLRLVVTGLLLMHCVFGFRLETRPYLSSSPTPYLWAASILALGSCISWIAVMWRTPRTVALSPPVA